MSTMASYLVVGGNKAKRDKEIENVYQKIKSAPFQKDTEVLILEKEAGIGIEEIRNLKHWLSLKSPNPPKVCLIKESQNLTLEAQAALSKLLEEPPGETVTILSSSNISQLLPTLVSRCQIINLPPEPEISLSEEEIKNSQGELQEILRMSPGEKIKFCERFRSREEAERFCQVQLLLWREILLKNPSPEVSQVLREIQETLKYLSANVNSRLALENLLFSYPHK